MSTYRYTSNLVLATLQQKFSDRKITFDQVNYWVQVVANRLIYQRLNKRNSDTGVYLVGFTGMPVKIIGQRKTIELPDVIVEMEEDKGIDAISYIYEPAISCENPLGEVTFERTMPHEVKSLYALPMRNPRPEMPFFYRTGSTLYLLGIEKINVPYLDMWLHMGTNPQNLLDIDTDIHLDVSQEQVLIAQVISLCRFGMLLPQERLLNGSDNTANEKNETALASAPIEQQNNQQPLQN